MKAAALELTAHSDARALPDRVRELEAADRQHVHGAGNRHKRLAARRMVQPAQSAESMRVMREVDAHAFLLGSDRSIAVLTPRIVRTIPPPGIEVQESLQLGQRSRHGRMEARLVKEISALRWVERKRLESMRK